MTTRRPTGRLRPDSTLPHAVLVGCDGRPESLDALALGARIAAGAGAGARLVLGGVTAETLRRAPCAVAVAPRGWADGPRSLGRIGVAVDGSPRDARAARLAVAMASLGDPHGIAEAIGVVNTNARQDYAGQQEGARVTAGLRVDRDVRRVIVSGEVADQLAARSAQLDLLVLDGRPRGTPGLMLLGNVTAQVVGMARCPGSELWPPARGDLVWRHWSAPGLRARLLNMPTTNPVAGGRAGAGSAMSATSGTSDGRRAVVDAHVHLFDHGANRHGFLERRDETFEALIGDYSALPRTYLFDDYLRDSGSRRVEGIVWHEFLSADPVREARWGQALANASPIPQAVVALVEFRDSALEERLDAYRALPNVTAVREHLGWDPANSLRRFAARSDLLTDAAWRAGLSRLGGWDVACGLEVFAHQLPELLDVVRLHPDIRFTVAVMGWPLNLTADGQARWRGDVAEISRCENVCASISAVECVLGRGWTVDAARPWVETIIDHFGPGRCMIGSHMPIARLARGFEAIYDAYEELLADLSTGEQDSLFRGTATAWFGLDRLGLAVGGGGAAARTDTQYSAGKPRHSG